MSAPAGAAAQPRACRRRRSFSLRTRVAAAAALGAVIIAAVLSWVASRELERSNLAHADQELALASRVVLIQPVIAVGILSVTGPDRSLAVTVYKDGAVQATTAVELPPAPVGSTTITVAGTPFRMLTTTDNQPVGQTVSLGIPLTDANQTTADQQHWVLAGAGVAVAAAAGLGWVFGGRAVGPIADLTRQVGAHRGTRWRTTGPNSDPGVPDSPVDGSGVREAEQLSAAVNALLERVDAAQAETAAALATARDFAAVSAHELRTPLTAMRTDLEVLTTLDLDDEQRAEILSDLQRGQGRVETTLAALERLAAGELTNDRDHVETDLLDLVDQAVHDAGRHFPQLDVRVDADPHLVTRGLPTGLRLALDNALTNSARHGGATRALVSAHRRGGRIVLTVDDNGRGIPEAERAAVFERFFRGSEAIKGGSGLGLALVAQQAQLHGGRAYFDDGTLGGVRLVLELPARW